MYAGTCCAHCHLHLLYIASVAGLWVRKFDRVLRSVSSLQYTHHIHFLFTLPDLTRYTEDFRGFLEKDLIEMSALISLEQTGRLNWWADTGTCQRLWPLATERNGGKGLAIGVLECKKNDNT